ncbi:MAG: hypothetical protein WBG86_20575 [Polyangiales bacterium]
MRLMRYTALVVVALGAVVPAAAAEDPSATVVEDPPSTDLRRSYEEYRFEDLERRTRVTGNALIGTTAATALGMVFLFPGLARQCTTIQNFDGTESLDCTTAGKALVGIGFPLFIGGLTGMLITGIMYGVRRGKVRRHEQRMAFDTHRVVRWDPAAARFVF